MKNYKSWRKSGWSNKAGILLFALAVLAGCSFFTGKAHAEGTNFFVYWPTNSNGYTKHEWTLAPQADPSPDSLFWANQVQLKTGPTTSSAAYAGLQTKGTGGAGKIALFSIFGGIDAVAGPGATAESFFEGVSGYKVSMPYVWNTGVSYRLKIQLDAGLLASGQGRWWGFWVKDEVSGIEKYLGRVKTPDSFGNIQDASGNFAENYGGDKPCEETRYGNMQWYNMTMSDSSGTYSPTNFVDRLIYGQCPDNIEIVQVPLFGAVYQIRGLNNSHSSVTFNVNGLPNHSVALSFSSGGTPISVGDCGGGNFYVPETCQSTTAAGNIGSPSSQIVGIVNASTVPADYVFTSWSGLCNGYGPWSTCSFNTDVDDNKILTANFSKRARLNITTSGAGSAGAAFSSAGGSIGSCGTSFTTPNSSAYACRSGLTGTQTVAAIGASNGTVKIYPTTPPAGYHATGWTGDCLSVDAFGGCAVYVAAGGTKNITATFAHN